MKRTILITALALLALAIPAAAGAKVPRSFFGTYATDPTEADFKGIADTGFGVSRFELSWRAIQTTRKGGFNWGYVDARMAQIAANGLRPALVVFGTPRFVRKSPDGFFPPTTSRVNRREWQQFLAAATRRYGPKGEFWEENPGLPASPVRQWIIWNEQNARAFWRPRPDPRDYAKLLKISDQAISKVDPKAELVLGGMYGYPKDSRSLSAVAFLRKLYRVKGARTHFDAINVHPYGAGVGAVRKQVKQARAVARKAGDRSVKTLVGEVGWASSGPKKNDEVVGPKGQAKRLSKALRLLARKRRGWKISGVYVYIWRDFTAETTCQWCPGAGLVKVDGEAKPALKAVRAAIRKSR